MFVRFVLRVDVAAEIGHQLIEVTVWLQHVVVAVWLFRRESALTDLVDDAAQVAVSLDIAQWVVTVAAEFFDLLDGVTEDKAVVRADFSKISTFAPSSVPMQSAPLRANFMLLVPDASVPASEICSCKSAAGMMIWARLTL